MPDATSPPSLHTVAEALRALGHPIRIKILQLLSDKKTASQSVTQIYKAVGASQAITSQHLVVMKGRDLLKSKKVGTNVYYSIAQSYPVKVLALLRKELGDALA